MLALAQTKNEKQQSSNQNKVFLSNVHRYGFDIRRRPCLAPTNSTGQCTYFPKARQIQNVPSVTPTGPHWPLTSVASAWPDQPNSLGPLTHWEAKALTFPQMQFP